MTGDHPSTAEAIAGELDALNGRRILSGIELDELDDDQLVWCRTYGRRTGDGPGSP